MLKLTIPPKALFLGLTLGLGGLASGLAVGSWIMPLGIAFLNRRDWSTLIITPRSYGIFPMIPTWYTPAERTLWNVGAFLAIITATVGLTLALRYWRFLVVKKYRWMTDKEATEFLNRDKWG